MIEQELASIMQYVLDATGNPYPYYWKVPESFRVPSVFFPPPEIMSGADTLTRYSLDYSWMIKIFASTDNQAYDIAQQALETFRRQRNLVPLLTEDGEKAEKGVRLADPNIKHLDDGVYQLALTWTVRRPYDTEAYLKMQTFDATYYIKSQQQELADAYTILAAAG